MTSPTSTAEEWADAQWRRLTSHVWTALRPRPLYFRCKACERDWAGHPIHRWIPAIFQTAPGESHVQHIREHFARTHEETP